MTLQARCPYCKNDIDLGSIPTVCPRCRVSLEGVNFETADKWKRETTSDEVAQFLSYLLPSAISILFGWVFGIIATIYALLAIKAKTNLQIYKAERYSNAARSWMIASYVVGIAVGVLRIVGRI